MNNIRYYKILGDVEKVYVGKENDFYIAILQFDWIDEFNVCFVTDGKTISSKFEKPTYLPDDLSTDAQGNYNHLYSVFRCKYCYTEPCDNMEAHWYFRVGFREFWTESIHFKVLEGI